MSDERKERKKEREKERNIEKKGREMIKERKIVSFNARRGISISSCPPNHAYSKKVTFLNAAGAVPPVYFFPVHRKKSRHAQISYIQPNSSGLGNAAYQLAYIASRSWNREIIKIVGGKKGQDRGVDAALASTVFAFLCRC